MKYLFTILAFVILCSSITLYYLLPSKLSDSQDVALSINGHIFSQEQLDDRYRSEGYHSEDTESSMESLVTRQLLLDEAQRLEIDKEQAFSKALKKYYEQSLVKILVERKLQSITVNVSEEEIDRYLSCSGKMFTFTRIPMEKGKLLEKQAQQNSVLFDDLSESLRLVLGTLQPGEQKVQFETGTEIGTICLNRTENADGFDPVVYDRDRVRELLANYQKSSEIDRWINGLRKKATIIVYDEEEKND